MVRRIVSVLLRRGRHGGRRRCRPGRGGRRRAERGTLSRPCDPAATRNLDIDGRKTASVKVLGVAGVPASGVAAVAATITVGRGSAGGYVTVFANGSRRPGTSNIGFSAGRAQSDQMYSAAGPDGRVAIFNGGTRSARVYVDITGYFTASALTPGSFVPTTPSRVLDTRAGSRLPARAIKTFSVPGHGGIPSSGASTVVMTLTALHSSRSGYLTTYADGTPRPKTSNVDFAAGQAVGNQVVGQLGADGKVSVYNGSDGPVDLVGDVQGYFVAGPPQSAGAFVAAPPTRSAPRPSPPDTACWWTRAPTTTRRVPTACPW